MRPEDFIPKQTKVSSTNSSSNNKFSVYTNLSKALLKVLCQQSLLLGTTCTCVSERHSRFPPHTPPPPVSPWQIAHESSQLRRLLYYYVLQQQYVYYQQWPFFKGRPLLHDNATVAHHTRGSKQSSFFSARVFGKHEKGVAKTLGTSFLVQGLLTP